MHLFVTFLLFVRFCKLSQICLLQPYHGISQFKCVYVCVCVCVSIGETFKIALILLGVGRAKLRAVVIVGPYLSTLDPLAMP